MATIRVTSDGDPYPAKAGNPLRNDGNARSFDDGSVISDQTHDFTIRYRAGSNTSDPETIYKDDPFGITTNGVLIYAPGSSSDTLPISSVGAPVGFTWNTIENISEYQYDACHGKPEASGEYRYRSGLFYKHGMVDNTEFGESTTYYSEEAYGTDKMRHETSGHSKIIGFAFDGYPIYGPYGYQSPTDSASTVIQMRSSYSTKSIEASGRIFSYQDRSAGSFIEDYVYVPNTGTLDEHNGRYCVTPDYTSGTYAYFITFSDTNFENPEYPYIIGPSTREQRSVTNNNG